MGNLEHSARQVQGLARRLYSGRRGNCGNQNFQVVEDRRFHDRKARKAERSAPRAEMPESKSAQLENARRFLEQDRL